MKAKIVKKFFLRANFTKKKKKIINKKTFKHFCQVGS